MHHYPFHPGDYMLSTAHLSLEEDATYRRALDHYYDTEAPLALDKRTLSKRLRVDEQTLSNVLEEFFFETPEGWKHTRCDAEIARYKAKSEKAKAAGALGGAAKSSKRLANAKQTVSENIANQELEPRTKNQSNTPIVPKGTDWKPTAEQLRVASWFGRRATTRWSDKELKSWKAIASSLDTGDLDALERRYTSNDPETVKYRKQEIYSLLNNWPGEVDKARRWTPPQVSNVTAKDSSLDETPWFEKPELP